MRIALRLLAFAFVQVRGAVIEVTAGGHVTEPTYQFSGWEGEHVANMSVDANGTIIASSNILADDFKLRAGGTLAQLARSSSRPTTPCL